jgi:hypothetical protein
MFGALTPACGNLRLRLAPYDFEAEGGSGSAAYLAWANPVFLPFSRLIESMSYVFSLSLLVDAQRPTNHLSDGWTLSEITRGQNAANETLGPVVECFLRRERHRIQDDCLRLRSATTVTCRSWAMRTMSSAWLLPSSRSRRRSWERATNIWLT